jgi:hypothetical protein
MENIPSQAKSEYSWEDLRLFLRELSERQAENERVLNEKFAELAKSQAETDRQIKETDLQMKETDRLMKETDRQMKETDRKMAAVTSQMGGWDKSHGQFAEEYFINSLNNGDKKFFGEKFDKLIANYNFSNSSTNKKGEFDIIFINGTAAAIIEVKFKARKNDFQQLLKQVPSFREEFPQYKSHRVYLGMAALTYENDVEKELKAEGIAIFKQDGETMVVTDENLKTF